MTDLTTLMVSYLVIHGITTIGTIILFLIRNEHRITKLETRLNYHEKSPHTPTITLDHPKKSC